VGDPRWGDLSSILGPWVSGIGAQQGDCLPPPWCCIGGKNSKNMSCFGPKRHVFLPKIRNFYVWRPNKWSKTCLFQKNFKNMSYLREKVSPLLLVHLWWVGQGETPLPLPIYGRDARLQLEHWKIHNFFISLSFLMRFFVCCSLASLLFFQAML
jgi:hypothetical protein